MIFNERHIVMIEEGVQEDVCKIHSIVLKPNEK
jgi:hypothetical protein